MTFTPRSDIAEWRMLFDELKTLAVGAVLTYERCGELLGRDLRDNRGPIYRAHKELNLARGRAIVAVKNQGYRIIQAREHGALARRHETKSRRQVERAVVIVEVTDTRDLDSTEREELQRQKLMLTLLVGAHRHLVQRFNLLESRVEDLEAQHEDDDDENR